MFFNYCSVFIFKWKQHSKNRTVLFLYHCSVLHYCSVFVPLFRFCTTVPFSTTDQKWNSVFLYHCSVFSYHCSVFCTNVPRFFFTRNNGTKTEQCVFCTTFPLFFFIRDNGTKRKQCVFVPLFHFALLFRFCTTVPFLYYCSLFHNGTKNGTVCFCTTVPFFRTTVPFFALLFRFFTRNNGTKTEQCVFCTIFCCFFILRDNGTKLNSVVVLTSVLFFSYGNNETKTEQCVFVQLFRFCTTVPFFQTNRKDWFFCGSFMFFCLTVSLSLSHWYPGSGVVLYCIDS